MRFVVHEVASVTSLWRTVIPGQRKRVLVSDSNEIDSTDESETYESGGRNWSRVLLVILFALIYQVAELVFFAVTLFQVVCMLVTGDRNDRLNEFAGTLTGYIYDVLEYLCLRSDEQPWPLGASATSD
jgi:hypothetical protein